MLRRRRGERKKPLEQADQDTQGGEDDEQDAGPRPLDDALGVEYPEGRTANKEEDGKTGDEEAPFLQLFALFGFIGLL